MNESFGILLKSSRKRAKLTQARLGSLVNLDASMISRFENALSIPQATHLQGIIEVFVQHEVPDPILRELREAAREFQAESPQVQDEHPAISIARQALNDLNTEHKAVVESDIQSIVMIDQGIFTAEMNYDEGKLPVVAEQVKLLRRQADRLSQSIFSRLDELEGRNDRGLGRYRSAINNFESALLTSRNLKDKLSEARILILLGDAHRHLGGLDLNSAFERYEEAQKIFQVLDDRRQLADTIRRMAAVYLFQGVPDKASKLTDESLELCFAEDYVQGKYKAYQHKSWAYDLMGRWSEATELAEKALGIVEISSAGKKDLYKALRYLGDAYRLQRDYQKAESTYARALKERAAISKDQDYAEDDPGLQQGMIQLGLGQVYLKLPGHMLEAKNCLEESFHIHRKTESDYWLARALIEQGTLQFALGKHDEAEKRLKLAYERMYRWGNPIYQAIALSTLCELYYKKGKESFDQLYTTVNLLRGIQSDWISYQRAKVELTVGKAYLGQHNYKDAWGAFNNALNWALGFNGESFEETTDEILEMITQVVTEDGQREALQVLNFIQQTWQQKVIEPSKRSLVLRLLEETRQKQAELDTLMAIQ